MSSLGAENPMIVTVAVVQDTRLVRHIDQPGVARRIGTVAPQCPFPARPPPLSVESGDREATM